MPEVPHSLEKRMWTSGVAELRLSVENLRMWVSPVELLSCTCLWHAGGALSLGPPRVATHLHGCAGAAEWTGSW